MFQFSFKNRIAFYYLLSTAFIVFIVFIIIYLVVSTSVILDVNRDLSIETERHLEDVKKLKDTTHLVKPGEWSESEHMEININPIFVQIQDRNGKFMEKSPNLKDENLVFYQKDETGIFHDTTLGNIHIRQTQSPLVNHGKRVGYVIIAMSTEEPKLVVDNLRWILYITFPIVLLVLFFATRLIAGRSISPVLNIIDTTSRITKNNFDDRIKLPENRDELFTLSTTINNLLDRIESAIKREKQFTSDASHELRTPLAVVKGTLEVLIRKQRDTKEYQEKIQYCISEVDRLNNLVDQLLLLARFENQKIIISQQDIALDEIILESLQRFSSKIESGNMAIDFTFEKHFYISSDTYLVSIIIENLLSNALKYSNPNSLIRIVMSEDDFLITCKFIDNGIGIAESDLNKIYEQFYRSQAIEHPAIKGNGLGLSLVKRLCDLLGVTLSIESKEGKGTTATLEFPKM
ncbi:MAG TPA: HAMP domain-containing sensor histidine kinase [Flavobacterium sp.]|nr:HAMP domain-containing sensor histidine kinase [Flavobacterium sp.]